MDGVGNLDMVVEVKGLVNKGTLLRRGDLVVLEATTLGFNRRMGRVERQWRDIEAESAVGNQNKIGQM